MTRDSRRRARAIRAGVALCIALLLGGCAGLRKPIVPMPVTALSSDGGGRCLAILLPGVHSSHDQFAREGFDRMAREQGIPIDLVAADAHLGYYRNRSVAERLQQDVVAPARAAGYEEIWIVGTSLGGVGGLLYLREHPTMLSGVYVIAPFLGDAKVIDEIERAGGPGGWVPPHHVEENDVGRKLWSWIVSGGLEATGVPVHLGWGTRDDFDRANRMLSGVLPPERVYTVDGGHDWKAWNELWARFLERARPCGARETGN